MGVLRIVTHKTLPATPRQIMECLICSTIEKSVYQGYFAPCGHGSEGPLQVSLANSLLTRRGQVLTGVLDGLEARNSLV